MSAATFHTHQAKPHLDLDYNDTNEIEYTLLNIWKELKNLKIEKATKREQYLDEIINVSPLANYKAQSKAIDTLKGWNIKAESSSLLTYCREDEGGSSNSICVAAVRCGTTGIETIE